MGQSTGTRVADVVVMPLYVTKFLPTENDGNMILVIGGGGGSSRMGVQNELVSVRIGG
jgi:hypothetical protein